MTVSEALFWVNVGYFRWVRRHFGWVSGGELGCMGRYLGWVGVCGVTLAIILCE